MITTNAHTELKTDLPQYKKNEFIWTIQFPYQTIHTATNRNLTYTELFFESLKTILTHYDVLESEIEQLKEIILAKISNTTNYDLRQEELDNTQYVRERRADIEQKTKKTLPTLPSTMFFILQPKIFNLKSKSQRNNKIACI